MKRYFDLNKLTDNNFCDDIDESFMVEIPDDGKPYGLVENEVVCVEANQEYIQSQKDEQIGSIMDEQIAVLTQFDITWSRNVVFGKKTMEQMETARDTLRQSYIDRINEVQNG